LRASRLNGSLVTRGLEFALPFEPWAYDPAKAKKLRGVRVCTSGTYGNAATRISEYAPSGVGRALRGGAAQEAVTGDVGLSELADDQAARQRRPLQGAVGCAAGRDGAQLIRRERRLEQGAVRVLHAEQVGDEVHALRQARPVV
jgi:hypothetical protein